MYSRKLQTELFIRVIGYVLVTHIILGIVISLFMSNEIRNRIYEDNDNILTVVESEVLHYLEHPLMEMFSAKMNETDEKRILESELPQVVEPFRKPITRMHYLTRYEVLDSEGIVVGTEPYNEDRIGFDLSQSKQYTNIVDSNKDVDIGEVIYDPLSDATTLYVTMTLDDGYIVGYAELSILQKLVDKSKINDGILCITDSYGTYLSHSDSEMIEQRVMDPNVIEISNGSLKRASVVNYNNKKYILQYREISNTEDDYWYLLYYQNIDQINEPITRMNITIIVVFLISIPFLVISIYIVLKHVNDSFEEFYGATKKIKTGNYNIEERKIYYKEFEDLFVQFKVMSQEVSKREDKITNLNEELENNFYMNIILLAKAIEAKDTYTGNHCERVRDFSMMIGEALNLSEPLLRELKYGSTLHDVGKLGIPESVLNKPDKFTDEEYELIKQHSQIGYDILRELPSMQSAKEVILYHHERMDGRGYPGGLMGKSIPLLARIVCIADAYDAMTSLRPYRKRAMTQQEGIDELVRNKGKQFDGELVDIFIAILSS